MKEQKHVLVMLFGVCFGSKCLLLLILIDSLNANNKIK